MRRLPNTYPGNTTLYPNGRGTIAIGAADAGSKVLFYNETPVNLDLDFYNGDTDVLHAWEANFWLLDGEVSDITWAIDTDSLQVVNPPINAIFATIFNPNETLNTKAYPMPLIRQIGGQQAIVSSASTVVNDGNALLQVIEATLQGHGSSDIIINNDGSYTLKGAGLLAAVGVLTHILGTLTVDQATTLAGLLSANGGIQLPNNVALSALDAALASHDILKVAASNHVQIGPAGQGIDQIDGSGNIILRTTSTAVIANKVLQMLNNVAIQSADSGGTQRNMISMDASNVTHIGTGAVGAQVRFEDSAGTELGWFDSGGGGCVNTTFKAPKFQLATVGGVNFAGIAGTLSRFTFFTGTGSGTYSHSQGVTPQWVCAVTNVAGSATQGFDSGTSTQVHITLGAANAFTAMVMNS